MATNFLVELQASLAKGPAARKKVVDRVTAMYVEAGLNLTKLAPKLGVSLATLNRAIRPDRNADLAESFRMARGGGVEEEPKLAPLDPEALLAFLRWLGNDNIAGFCRLDKATRPQLQDDEVETLITAYNESLRED